MTTDEIREQIAALLAALDEKYARDLAERDKRIESLEDECDELGDARDERDECIEELAASFRDVTKALDALLGFEHGDDPAEVDAVRAAFRAHDDLLDRLCQ